MLKKHGRTRVRVTFSIAIGIGIRIRRIPYCLSEMTPDVLNDLLHRSTHRVYTLKNTYIHACRLRKALYQVLYAFWSSA